MHVSKSSLFKCLLEQNFMRKMEINFIDGFIKYIFLEKKYWKPTFMFFFFHMYSSGIKYRDTLLIRLIKSLYWLIGGPEKGRLV